jgi:aminoglycoside phosphotransferase family enzyme
MVSLLYKHLRMIDLCNDVVYIHMNLEFRAETVHKIEVITTTFVYLHYIYST